MFRLARESLYGKSISERNIPNCNELQVLKQARLKSTPNICGDSLVFTSFLRYIFFCHFHLSSRRYQLLSNSFSHQSFYKCFIETKISFFSSNLIQPSNLILLVDIPSLIFSIYYLFSHIRYSWVDHSSLFKIHPYLVYGIVMSVNNPWWMFVPCDRVLWTLLVYAKVILFYNPTWFKTFQSEVLVTLLRNPLLKDGVINIKTLTTIKDSFSMLSANITLNDCMLFTEHYSSKRLNWSWKFSSVSFHRLQSSSWLTRQLILHLVIFA